MRKISVVQIGLIATAGLCQNGMNPFCDFGTACGSDYHSAEAKPFCPADRVDRANRIQTGVTGLIDKCQIVGGRHAHTRNSGAFCTKNATGFHPTPSGR
jgi:hypothetical protein